mmetsp:Transcript_7668/g.13444  ORF Transcript_7668/g.13444 Transcript_7668/m.13444 type:complete len:202 (-) Transcript_7668:909-1514(-)|eukprot:CAMPEP_0184516450 /NCGR_PEP_ID=MMETSP0198_2-20121128/5037_1 /TAXON_ID=1112570 /ORGANISM="Thraustochytrium sp., Strain LLF1b" /LENGTH=201 /DNA_ID=CAMNT_0026906775 /DNA_START=176 /DNA_END=781 /DNA_ORIENTATION=-
MTSWACCCCPSWCPLWPKSEEDSQLGEQSSMLENSEANYGSVDRVVSQKPAKAFVFAQHKRFGLLVLKAFKARKGLHGQLPGGKVDETDADAKAGLARELFEETGIDVRQHLERLHPVLFPHGDNMYRKRYYFKLELFDSDAVGDKKPDTNEKFTLSLSHEHVGYVFEHQLAAAAELITLHSGGANREALVQLQDTLELPN